MNIKMCAGVYLCYLKIISNKTSDKTKQKSIRN